MEPPKDAIYYEQLAKIARKKASLSDDRAVSIRLREAAIRHERQARRLRREESKAY